MKVMLDTNVVLDVVLQREPHWHSSQLALQTLRRDRAQLLLSTSAVTDIYYLIRRATGAIQPARQAVEKLFQLAQLVEVTAGDITRALSLEISDFEDAVVTALALRLEADLICTRNVKDFSDSPVPAKTPAELVKSLG